MKNKKLNGKKNKKKSNINELNNLIGKRRKREATDIIIKKYDIYSILEDLNYDVNFKIPKRKSNETTSDQLQPEKELEKFIKSESYSPVINEPVYGVSNLANGNFIKKEESPSKGSGNSNPNSASKQSLLNIILSKTQLLQFSDIIKIFKKEIESPFTLDYFMKLKEILKNERKDKTINTLLFLVWSLKFMKIDRNHSQVNTISNFDSFSLPATNPLAHKAAMNTDNYFSSNHLPNQSNIFSQYMPSIKTDGNIADVANNPNMMINKFMSNWNNTLNNINKDPQSEIRQANKEMYPQNFVISPLQPFGNSYIIPLNLLSSVPLINSPTFCLTNSNNIIQTQSKNSTDPNVNSKEVVRNTNNSSTEASRNSFADSRITLDSLLNNLVESNDNPQNKKDIDFTFRKEDVQTVKEINYMNIKKEQSFIDITMEDEDEKPKVENKEKVYCEIIKIFSRPITDETYKILKNYLSDIDVDKIEKTIKTSKKKQYIPLFKKDKEELFLKYDPIIKKYSISRTYYKSK